MSDKYHEHVRGIAEGIVKGIVADYKESNRLLDQGLEGESEELDEEIQQAASNADLSINRDEQGQLHYCLGLAGPGVGSTYVWLEGELDEDDDGYPKTVALKYLDEAEESEIDLEDPDAFKLFVSLAFGGSLVDMLENLEKDADEEPLHPSQASEPAEEASAGM